MTSSDKHPTASRSYTQERYYRLKAEHRCTNCGDQDERTLSGKTLCVPCAEFRSRKSKMLYAETREPRVRSPEYHKNHRERAKELYRERRAAHLCVWCGRPAVGNGVHCAEHKDYHKKYQEKRRAEYAERVSKTDP